MEIRKQDGRTFVVGRPNRANGACFDSRRARRDVDRLKNHYLQTGEGWPDTIVPHRNMRAVRSEVSWDLAAQNIRNRAFNGTVIVKVRATVGHDSPEASGMDDENEDGVTFEELIASLAGKNVEEATRLAEENITAAKVELENQEKNIDAMLGDTEEPGDEIPYPRLPEVKRSMESQEFVLAALKLPRTNCQEARIPRNISLSPG